MLQIVTENNENLLLDDSVKISLTEVNPILVKDKNSSSLNFSLPFKLNHSYLNNPHRMGKKRSADKTVNVSYNSFKRAGMLKYNKLNNDKYTCNVTLSSFFLLFGDKSIRELKLGGKRKVESLEWDYDKEMDFEFLKVYNYSLMEDTELNEYYTNSLEGYINIDKDDFLFGEKRVHIPYCSLAYVYEQIFLEHGYRIKYNVLRNNDFLKYFKFYSTQVADGKQREIMLNKFLPDVKIKDFVNAISDLLNVHVLINENLKLVEIVSYNSFFDMSNFIDITSYCQDDFCKIKEELPNKFVFKIQPVSDDKRQSPHVFLDEQKNLSMGTPVDKISDLPTPNRDWLFNGSERKTPCTLVKEDWKYYTVVLNTETEKFEWQPYTINLQAVVIGTGDIVKEINPEVGIVFAGRANIQGNSYWRIDSKEIPFMLSKANKFKEEVLTPNKIFTHCWARAVEHQLNAFELYECTIDYPLAVFNNLSFLTKLKIHNMYFIIEEIKYNITNNKIEFGTTKLRAI